MFGCVCMSLCLCVGVFVCVCVCVCVCVHIFIFMSTLRDNRPIMCVGGWVGARKSAHTCGSTREQKNGIET